MAMEFKATDRHSLTRGRFVMMAIQKMVTGVPVTVRSLSLDMNVCSGVNPALSSVAMVLLTMKKNVT